MSKILIAGNPEYGVAKALAKVFPNATFCCRSNGLQLDLTLYKRQRELAQISLEYDIFISVSSLWKFHQTTLVQEVAKVWKENKHKGYLIAFGSSADTPVKASTWLYPTDKKALRAYMRGLSQIVSGEEYSGFKTTYISPGHIHTPAQDKKHPTMQKLSADYVAGVVEWLVKQPTDVNISEVCLDKIRNKEE